MKNNQVLDDLLKSGSTYLETLRPILAVWKTFIEQF